jgi:ADP-dependent NAD(P)H-hydrate dehydratase
MADADVIPVNELPRLPRRAADAHKGTFGRVLVVAGSKGMSGAAVLTGRAALRAGAGLVQVATPAAVQPEVAAAYPAYTTFPIRQHADESFAEGAAADVLDLAKAADGVAVGPGLGRWPDVGGLVRRLLGELPQTSVVVDADGLNVLAPLAEDFSGRPVRPVLTPHPGEFARLTGKSLPASPDERLRQAVGFAARFGVVLLLKGSGTLVTDGIRAYRNSTGNPGMATGGSGDVLTGVIAALAGQGFAPFEAAVLGAWAHGRAGDLAAAALGQTALTAVDLLDHLPAAFRELETRT